MKAKEFFDALMFSYKLERKPIAVTIICKDCIGVINNVIARTDNIFCGILEVRVGDEVYIPYSDILDVQFFAI